MKSCINVSFTVEEALNIVKSFGWGEIHDKVTKAIVAACESNSKNSDYILAVHSIPQGKFVLAVKALRDCMNWGLLDAKNWMDIVRGKAHDREDGSYYYTDGISNILTTDDELKIGRAHV